MVENRNSVAATAIAGGVVGIILAVVGFYLVARAASPASGLGFLEVVFKALLGMFIGYTLGTLSGIYLAGEWPTREWPVAFLFILCGYLGTVIAILPKLGLEMAESAQLSLYLFAPPIAFASALRRIGNRSSRVQADLMAGHDTGKVKMGSAVTLLEELKGHLDKKQFPPALTISCVGSVGCFIGGIVGIEIVPEEVWCDSYHSWLFLHPSLLSPWARSLCGYVVGASIALIYILDRKPEIESARYLRLLGVPVYVFFAAGAVGLAVTQFVPVILVDLGFGGCRMG